ncbi:hydrolase [Streptomyces inusitatus]|uniref:Hydrolase n=1 Tax=Streptomyces inusitatus TaxID=68221 RepID=A0A918PXI6_9ACTN|nr:hydrolase [Streptomyces inusitatus]
MDAALPDTEAGKRFYGELFGWTFRPGDGPWTDAYSDGLLAAAIAPKGDGRMPTIWNVYLAADDITALAARVPEAGGHLISSPRPVGRLGAVAMAADPGGAVFGLWQAGGETGGEAGGRAGFETRGVPGAYCWTEVYTWRKDRVDPFYEEVFGYTGTDLPRPAELGPGCGPAMDIRLWSPRTADPADPADPEEADEPGERTAVAGRCVLTEAFPPELPGHFLVYFCVKDCDAAAATVVRLGGRVQAPPFDIPYGRIAVLMDNQGALFAVLAET